MMKSFSLAFIAAMAVVFISGCVTREDIRGIQTDLYTIQQGLEKKLGTVEDQTNTVQTSQADLATTIAELNQNIEALNAELQDSRNRVDKLSMRLDDLEAALQGRMDLMIELISGSKFTEKPLPTTVYNLAKGDYVRGRTPDAIKGFKDYIERFPKGEKVPDAKLKIGESYIKQKKWSTANKAFNELIKEFPEHRLVPTALLKKANAYEARGDVKNAKKVYIRLLTKYPYRPEAKRAKEALRFLDTMSQ